MKKNITTGELRLQVRVLALEFQVSQQLELMLQGAIQLTEELDRVSRERDALKDQHFLVKYLTPHQN